MKEKPMNPNDESKNRLPNNFIGNEDVEYIEHVVDKINYDGYEIVRKEFLSKAYCPAVMFRYGSIQFNIKAIRKLDARSHIQFLINKKDMVMMVKPCGEDDIDSSQWCRIDKHNTLIARKITCKVFTALIYQSMNWAVESSYKILGALYTAKDEKVFVFRLMNAEAYSYLAEPSEEDPNRRRRVPYMPKHWQGNFGDSYEESQKPIVSTFEEGPEGFVRIEIQKLPPKKKPTDETGQNDSPEPDQK
jgi:hypothetical protein